VSPLPLGVWLVGDSSSQTALQITGGSSPLVGAGKWPLLFLLFGLVAAFVLVRINTRLIRKGVSWWFGNIESGDLHIHHVVFGFSVMVLAGILEFALTPSGWTQRIIALVFGAATGVALDEFALILHLKDVYWTTEGRQSIDAVVVAVAVVVMLLIGLAPLGVGDQAAASRWGLFGYLAVHLLFVVTTLVKGKLWAGVVGVFIPVFAWVGAFRLARPNSPWAHRRYKDNARKLERAEERAAHSDRTVGRWRDHAFDLVGGKPTALLRPKRTAIAPDAAPAGPEPGSAGQSQPGGPAAKPASGAAASGTEARGPSKQ
jgi:lysyl-tRNA synthetase class 2